MARVDGLSCENMRLKYAAMTPTQRAAFTAAIRASGYSCAMTKVAMANSSRRADGSYPLGSVNAG